MSNLWSSAQLLEQVLLWTLRYAAAGYRKQFAERKDMSK
jgi:hypothetical protein